MIFRRIYFFHILLIKMRPQLWSNHISGSHDFNKRELTPPEDTYLHTYVRTYVRTNIFTKNTLQLLLHVSMYMYISQAFKIIIKYIPVINPNFLWCVLYLTTIYIVTMAKRRRTTTANVIKITIPALQDKNFRFK